TCRAELHRGARRLARSRRHEAARRQGRLGFAQSRLQYAARQRARRHARLASMVSKVQGADWQRWITTEEVLEAATVGSARALGLGDKIGRLEEDYKADIVFLDLEQVNWIPCNDPTNQIVHTEDGTAVHSVMIGGRMVVENRKLLTVDLADLAAKAEQVRARLEAANRPARALYDKLE